MKRFFQLLSVTSICDIDSNSDIDGDSDSDNDGDSDIAPFRISFK